MGLGFWGFFVVGLGLGFFGKSCALRIRMLCQIVLSVDAFGDLNACSS